MIRLVLWVAVALFLIWVVLTLIGALFHGLINLLWIGILVALAIWAWRFITARQHSHPQ